ncbi:tol-pal system protein YbgF [Methylobacterium oxalidis]|uniref:Cell division coordinator CpoB n=1 Tax=Methylobacterium oxalidis TaxID=944322 RepID=A0A512IWS3_9HYPH|nr:tol-pal system protein YbgF [Methylobacterium oxalidis]GEP02167.1 tol-pal system protein YbgF [Methylobacterium oxalidis]GJE32158.1 Cell division coordinator CpoB [Methylobacterium oxalidis]GLS62112.1 tol-pal system protein YbgF [Methylobacterium oxalidis]
MLRRLLLALCLSLSVGLPAAAQDASEFVVRLNRLENQSRMMAGQIETLQYENRQLKEQLRKFQEDVEYRLQEGKGGGAKPAGGGAVNGGNPGTPKPQKRGDAFDPEQNPGRPGAPMQLGTTTPSAPVAAQAAPVPAAGPSRLPAGAIDEAEEAEGDLDAAGPGAPVDLTPPSRIGTTGALPPAVRPKASVAATGSGDAKADYEVAYAYILQRQYEQAEMSLRQFIQSHPRDGLVPAATYWLGESYLQRNRNREAAEQFLKVSTDYARSAQAPEAMLKLGASLNALGAREQACATLAELERKFPSASANVRQGVTREQKRARCAA